MSRPILNPYEPPNAPVVDLPELPLVSRGRRRWFVVHVILWVLNFGLYSTVVPRMMAVAADFGLPLPLVTVWVAGLASLVRGNLAIAILIFLAILVGDRALMARAREADRPWRIGFWLALPPLGLWLIAMAALFFTLMNVMTHLSG